MKGVRAHLHDQPCRARRRRPPRRGRRLLDRRRRRRRPLLLRFPLFIYLTAALIGAAGGQGIAAKAQPPNLQRPVNSLRSVCVPRCDERLARRLSPPNWSSKCAFAIAVAASGRLGSLYPVGLGYGNLRLCANEYRLSPAQRRPFAESKRSASTATAPNPYTTLLTKLANSCWHYPKRVLAALVLPTLLLGAAAGQLRLDGSLLGAVNDDDPQVVRLKELKAQFPAGGTMALLIEGGTELERRAVAQAASAALRRQPSILSATYRLDPFLAYQHGPLLVDDATHNALKEQLEGLAFLLTQPQGSEALELIFSADEADPSEAGQILDMTEPSPAMSPIRWSRENCPPALRSGWFPHPAVLYVVDLRTRFDPIADPVGDGFIPLKDALEPVKAAYPDVQMTFAGMVATAYEDQANVLSQLLPLSTVSMVLVLFLLSRLNRSLWSVLLTGAALGVALVWTFGLVHLVIGYASVMAAGFAILLFGLGIDHAAHLLLRFDRELRAGRAGDEAVRLMLVQTGRGVLVGGLATALAVGGLYRFKAAVHLGMTACIGMVADHRGDRLPPAWVGSRPAGGGARCADRGARGALGRPRRSSAQAPSLAVWQYIPSL